MAKQTINTGTVPSDGTGDGFRTSMTKVNSNFTEVYEALEDKAAANHDHIIDDTVGLQAALDAKATSSHTHAQSDVTGLQAALDGKAASSHTHAQSDVTGLVSALAGKADTSHTHAQSDVTGLVSALAGKADTSHTHAQSDVTGLVSALAGKAEASHTHAQSDVTGLVSALAGKAATDQKLDDFGTPDDNTDLNATTSRHGLLPKLGGGTTNFLRADGAWAAPAGDGGDAATFPKTVFVSASLGNNGTAVVGDPSKPYATAQAAFDAWVALDSPGRLHVMDGALGGIVLAADMGHNLQITGAGTHCHLGGVNGSGANGEAVGYDQPGNGGSPGYAIRVTSDHSVNLGAVAGSGGNGGNGGESTGDDPTSGGDGGASSACRLANAIVDSITLAGGAGGDGLSGAGPTDPTHGLGGDVGQVALLNVHCKGVCNILRGTSGGGDGSYGIAHVIGCIFEDVSVIEADVGVVTNCPNMGLTITGTVPNSANAALGASIGWP